MDDDEIQNACCQHLHWWLRECELFSWEEAWCFKVRSLHKQMKVNLKVFMWTNWYQMVTELVQVSCHTGHEDVQELCVLWLRLSGEEGGCSICFFVVCFSRNYCGNLATTAKVVIQTLSFKGRPPYKRENVIIVNVWKTSSNLL